MFDLNEKTSLVTGATGGIGEAIARRLHAQGANVVISGTRAERLEALAGELGANCHIAAADLSDPAAPDALIVACHLPTVKEVAKAEDVEEQAGVTEPEVITESKKDEEQKKQDEER